jgi:hypothetical protein
MPEDEPLPGMVDANQPLPLGRREVCGEPLDRHPSYQLAGSVESRQQEKVPGFLWQPMDAVGEQAFQAATEWKAGGGWSERAMSERAEQRRQFQECERVALCG